MAPSANTSLAADSTAAAVPSSAPLGHYPGSIEQAEFQIRNLIAAYEQIAQWIRFADTKAALVLTVNGLFASVLLATVGDLSGATPAGSATAATALLVVWALFAGLSCLEAFRCILPRALNDVHPAVACSPHFHPAAIAAHCRLDRPDEFVRAFDRLASRDYRDQVLKGMLIEAHISAAKYRHVIASIRLLAVAAPLGFACLAVVEVAT
jgi:hypothetical protein